MQLSDASERAQRKVIEKSSVWMYGVASKHRLRKCDGVAQKNTRLINSIVSGGFAVRFFLRGVIRAFERREVFFRAVFCRENRYFM